MIATAGPTRAAAPGEIVARVTDYGDGMAERVAALAGGRVDHALGTAQTGGRIDHAHQPSPAQPGRRLAAALMEPSGDPDRVRTVSDFAAAAELGTPTARIEMRWTG
ncbi:hypothetical protein [Streptomyces sp. NPDC005953]|uniref:hypothetical protein n=1 Tax=Streptomyces sp. NPDC005953 TaxID=3156719 RepID=UPI0033FB393C